MMRLVFFFVGLLIGNTVTAQQLFSLRLQPSAVNAPAVHSGAFGEYDGKWFFIGGRTNGLHGFQPPFAFPTSGVNNSIYIVNPATNQTWSADATTLPDSIREPLTSSNMQFYLSDTMLYMVGGYGWKDNIQDFVTWPTLIAINMKGLVPAVETNQPIAPYFRLLTDSVLAVCGAHLQKLDSTYYLVFGHRFDGRYDRIENPAFHIQEYTHEIRKFEINDNGTNLTLTNYRAVRDTANFRRRDYNLVPLLNPYKGNGLLAFSGVFRKDADLPYFNVIEIYPDTVIVRNDFSQNLSQYHCAVGLVYDSISAIQHNLFFGGMSMYYTDSVTGQTITDSLIPFVRTISDVAYDVDHIYHELDAGIRMPDYLGTNAYFLPDMDAPKFRGHYIHLNNLTFPARIGYIAGGILTPEINISETDPSLSEASAVVYEVYAEGPVGLPQTQQRTESEFYCYPNPAANYTNVYFNLPNAQYVSIELTDAAGRAVHPAVNRYVQGGVQKVPVSVTGLAKGIYYCLITTQGSRKAIRLAIN